MVTPELPEVQTIYVVERFLPTMCPNPQCLQEFKERGENGYFIGTYWLHERREVVERIKKSITALHSPGPATDLIVCGKCHNITLRVLLEERTYQYERDAEQACKEEGFVPAYTAEARGDMRVRGMRRTLFQSPRRYL